MTTTNRNVELDTIHINKNVIFPDTNMIQLSEKLQTIKNLENSKNIVVAKEIRNKQNQKYKAQKRKKLILLKLTSFEV